MAWSWCDIFALISLSCARSRDVTVARREARALAPPPPKKKTKQKQKQKKRKMAALERDEGYETIELDETYRHDLIVD